MAITKKEHAFVQKYMGEVLAELYEVKVGKTFADLEIGQFFVLKTKPDFLMRKESESSALVWNWRDGKPTNGWYKLINHNERVVVKKAYKIGGVWGFKPKTKTAKQKAEIKAKVKVTKDMKAEAIPGDGSRWEEI